MTVRGGGRPTMFRGCNTPQGRMGPLPRSFAADAHACIMVRASCAQPNTRLWQRELL